MDIAKLTGKRIATAKRAFTTRRVPARQMATLLSGNVAPTTGDLVLASVTELGKHQRIERVNGRRAFMMPGDEIIVTYGNRYAPDQFEALVCEDLSLCDLVAGGGIAAREVSRHDRMPPPTQIMPIGLIGDTNGKPLNLSDYRIDYHPAFRDIKVVLVVGTSMNSGKTFACASVIRGLKGRGYRVAGIKATGTGSGGDLWKMKDMGADITLDFTDAGFASTYKASDEAISRGTHALINNAANRRCDFAVVEIADGLQHIETANLLRDARLKEKVYATVFTASDSLGAKAGYDELLGLDYNVVAISGLVTRSPLAMRETARATNCPVFTPFEIQAGALIQALTQHDPSPVSTENDENGIAATPLVELGLTSGRPIQTRSPGGAQLFDFPEDLGETGR